jgi:hypothetical protein
MASNQTDFTKKKKPAKPAVVDGRLRTLQQQNATNVSKGGTAKNEGYTQSTPEDVAAAADAMYKKWMASQATSNKKSGSSGPSALDRYTRQLQSMLTGGSFAQPYKDLETKLGELYGQAQPQINDAMTNLQTTLQGMQNPYANFQAQTTQVTPELSQLLQSQGVPTNPLQEMAAATAAQNAGQSTAFGNLAGMLGTIYGANQQGMVGDVATQRANLTNALEQSRLGFGAQIGNQRMDQQSELMKQLLAAISKGGRPNAGRLF